VNKTLLGLGILTFVGFLAYQQTQYSNEDEVNEILARAGLARYRPVSGKRGSESKLGPGPATTATHEVGPFEIVWKQRAESCVIRLYENLAGWRRKLRGQWSGNNPAECLKKFNQVVEVTRETRAQKKLEQIKALRGY